LANLKDGQTKPGASIEAPVTQMGEGRPKKTASIEAVFTQDEAAKLLNVSERGDRSKPKILDLKQGDNQHVGIPTTSQTLRRNAQCPRRAEKRNCANWRIFTIEN
jgi:hypothetical protein